MIKRIFIFTFLFMVIIECSASNIVYEFLTFNVKPQDRLSFLKTDNTIWTSWLNKHPFFESKKVLYNQNNHDQLTLWIKWKSQDAFNALDSKELAAKSLEFDKTTKNKYQLIKNEIYIEINDNKKAFKFGMFPGSGQIWTPPKRTAGPEIISKNCPPCSLPANTCKLRKCQKTNNISSPKYKSIRVSPSKWMTLANQAAIASVKVGSAPFGAVILQIDSKTNEIIRYWVARNKVLSNLDTTAHAEIVAIREVEKDLGVINLSRITKASSKLPQPGKTSYCVMFASSEPCPMCISAIYWAGIKKLYFSATALDAAAPGIDMPDELLYQEVSKPYNKKIHMEVFKVDSTNSLDAFNLYKRSSQKR